MTTLSTGEVGKRLGVLLTAEFINKKLGVDPTEVVKSHPRWSEDNFQSICAALAGHCYDIAKAHTGKPKTMAKPKPATEVDDDDEL